MLWFFVFRFLFRRIKSFKKKLQDMNIVYESEVEWYSRCVSSEHAIGALVLSLLWQLRIASKPIILTHTAGYFLFDSFVVLSHIRDFKSETGTFLHHAVGLFGSWAGILFNTPVWLIKYYLITEASTLFVNLRWNFYLFGMKEGKGYVIVGLLMTVSFFLVRTCPMPYIWIRGAVWVWMEHGTSLFVKISQTVCVSVLCMLNGYWTVKIFQGIYKHLWKQNSEINP